MHVYPGRKPTLICFENGCLFCLKQSFRTYANRKDMHCPPKNGMKGNGLGSDLTRVFMHKSSELYTSRLNCNR
jgi:hypothetical protein